MDKEDSFFSPAAFAGEVEQIILGGQCSQEMSDFFCDGRCVELIEPYPEQSALHVFITWFACLMLYEETTETDLDSLRATPVGAPVLLPLEEALSDYGMKNEEDFGAFLSARNKTLAEADEDDVFDYFESFKECGTVEELGLKIADAVFPLVLKKSDVLHEFSDLVASHLAETTTEELDIEEALLFERDGVLHEVAPPARAKRQALDASEGRCVRCDGDLGLGAPDAAQPVFARFVPTAEGGLNDVSNLAVLCRTCSAPRA